MPKQPLGHHRPSDENGRPLKILLLCDDKWALAKTLIDHIEAFTKYSRHWIVPFNPRPIGKRSTPNIDTFGSSIDFASFDVIVIHYSIWVIWDNYLPPTIRQKIRAFKGLKVQFIQDEYRQVNRTIDVIVDLGIHVLFTLAPKTTADQIYGDPRLETVTLATTLAGYVPKNMSERNPIPVSDRPFDIGYRSRPVDFHLGRLTQEKVRIAKEFPQHADHHGLSYDISWRQEDRFYGDEWVNFLQSCKAVLGTESGASIVDFDGDIESEVEAFLRLNPDADFDTVFERVLRPHEGNILYNTISPRVFEAAALKTPLIMFPGKYSGIVAPWDHYIPLEPDFSNMADVADKIKDTAYLQDMADRTYRDIIATGAYSYARFLGSFDKVISDEYQKRIGKIKGGHCDSHIRKLLWQIHQRFKHILFHRRDRFTGFERVAGNVELS